MADGFGLDDLVVQLRVTVDGFTSDIKAAQRSTELLEKSLKPIQTQAKNIGLALSAMGGAVGGSLLLASKATAQYGAAINKASIQTGIAAEQLSKMKFAADQSETSFEGVAQGLKILARNAAEAAAGSKAQAEAFRSIGIAVRDSSGVLRPMNDLLLDVADQFKGMEDGTAKAALAQKIFGRSGLDLIPILNEGREGILRMGNEAERLGLVMSGDAARAADEFDDTLTAVKAATLGLAVAVGQALLPSLTSVAGTLRDGIAEITSFAKEHENATLAIGGLAAVITGAGGLAAGLALVVSIAPKVVVGLQAIASAAVLTAGSISGIASSLTILQGVRTYADVAAGISLIGGASIAARAGLIGVAAAVGFGIGSLINWAIEGTKVEKVLDSITAAIWRQIKAQTGLNILLGQDSSSELEKNTRRLSDSLLEQGIIVLRGSDSLAEWNKRVIDAAHGADTFKAALQSAAKAAKMPDDILEMRDFFETRSTGTFKGEGPGQFLKEIAEKGEEAAKKLEEAAKKLKDVRDQFTASLRPADDLNNQLAMLAGKFSDEQIIAVYAKAITEAADAQREHGLAITGEVARLEDWSRAHLLYLEELRAEKKLHEEIAKILENNKPQPIMSPLGGMATPTTIEKLPIQRVGLPIEFEIPEFDATKKWDEYRKAGQTAIDGIVNDISKMFTDMIGHGRSFWEAFKGLGKASAAAVADTFLQTMAHSFLDPLARQFGELLSGLESDIKGWAKSIAGFIKSNIGTVSLAAGGAAIGGAIGGKTGSVAGAAAGIAIGEAMKGNVIGAAIAATVALGAAMTKAFGEGRREADKFIQSFQNPFGDAVKSVFDALSQAKDMGTLTVDQTQKARAEIEKLWASFQVEAAKASHGVGQQAIATIAPLMESWRVWLDGLDQSAIASEAAAESLQDMIEQQEAVISIMERVLKASASASALSDAIQRLQAEGVPAANIITILGGDIKNMTELMISLGQNVPPAVSGLYDLLSAMEALESINTGIEDTFYQLADTLNRRMDELDSQIEESSRNIQEWSQQIQDINDDIADQSATLADASHWQREYDDAIRESAEQLQRLADQRKSLENKIKDATNKAETDRLQKIIDTTTDLGTYYRTQAEMAALAQRIKDEQIAEEKSSIGDMQTELANVIKQQQEAAEAYANAGTAAVAAIEQQKNDIAVRLAADLAVRDSLMASIALEQERIQFLREGQQLITDLMNQAGIARTNEADALSNSINELMYRGLLLEQERDRLIQVTGAAESASRIFAGLADTLARFTLTQAVTLPQYHAGTPYVPVTGPAMLEKGEAVISASKNSGGQWNTMNPVFNYYGSGGKDEVRKWMMEAWKEINHAGARPLTRQGR